MGTGTEPHYEVGTLKFLYYRYFKNIICQKLDLVLQE